MISERGFEALRKQREITTLDVADYIYRGDSLPPHVMNWLSLPEKHDKIFIEASRRHFKSRTFSVIFPLSSIIKDPETTIIIGSKTISQSQKWLREIKGHITSPYSPFSYLKPPDPVKWSESEIIVDRVDPSADPTVAITGVEKEILGSGAQKIILDDPVSPRNSKTPLQRKKVEEWFFQVLDPMLEPGGQMIVTGTPWHDEDLYHIFREDPEWAYYRFPAERPPEDLYEPYHDNYYQNPDEVLWYPKWDREELMAKRRSQGSVWYAMSYLLDLTRVQGGIIDHSWITWYGSLPDGSYQYVMAVDPAVGQKHTDDYTAIVVIARHRGTGRLYLIDWDQGRWESQERMMKMQTLFNRYPIQKIGVEDTAVSKDFIGMLRRETMLPITPLSHMGRDKVTRVQSISPRIESGDILFPNHMRHSKIPIYDQLIEFPEGSHDDLVDAFVYAVWLFVGSYGGNIFELFGGD